MSLRRVAAAFILLALAVALGFGALPVSGQTTGEPAADNALLTLDRFARVDIAPTRTSIYIGTVSMTMPTFVRADGVYAADYSAKVFPYFFYNEKGRLVIEVSDDALRQLSRGEPITFTGTGTNTSGETRRVEGRAVPADANSGAIKVRVFISKRIQLIFNTTYRFVP